MDVSIYFLIFTLVFVINSFVPLVKKKAIRCFLLLLSFVILVSFVGFRYNVGTDYDSYMEIYRSLKGESIDFALRQSIDPLNGIIMWICSKIFSVDYVLFLVYGITSILPIFLINRRFGYRFLNCSVALYCFMFLPFSLNGMMQGAAMCWVLLSSMYLIDRKRIKLIIALLIAFMLHKSALLVLPNVLLFAILRKKTKFVKFNILLTIVLSIFILFFLGSIFANSDFGYYKDYGYITKQISIERISISATLYYLPLAAFAFFTKKNVNNDLITFQRGMLYTGIIYNLIGSSATYLNRIALYYLIFGIIVVPYQISYIADAKKRLMTKVVLLSYAIAVFLVQVVVLGWHDVLPYQTWLFGGAG